LACRFGGRLAASHAGKTRQEQVAVSDMVIRTLRMSPRLREEILVHLIREAPNEGVGLLAVDRKAPHAEAMAFFPGENIDASPTRFTMHPRDVVGALDAMSHRGWELGAIVHSHMKGPATPSRTDIGEAHYPDTVMLIVSLASLPPDMRGWWLEERNDERIMRPVALDVVPTTAVPLDDVSPALIDT
jgi:[CysO sulfur-carrier protein]-S-L-cysteine hydrolase